MNIPSNPAEKRRARRTRLSSDVWMFQIRRGGPGSGFVLPVFLFFLFAAFRHLHQAVDSQCQHGRADQGQMEGAVSAGGRQGVSPVLNERFLEDVGLDRALGTGCSGEVEPTT